MPDPVLVVLDGRNIQSKAAFFQAFAAIDGVPDGMDDNVDALWDAITGHIEKPVELTWINAEDSRRTMGLDFRMILAVLQEAAQATAHNPDRPRFNLSLPAAPH